MSAAALEATGLHLSYARRGVTGAGARTEVLRGVDLRIVWGESWGIVGESGSGKSTLVRLLLALERPESGEIRFDGVPISSLPERRIRPLRRRFQAVFQDGYASLDPRLSIGAIVAEPLLAHRMIPRGGLDSTIAGLLRTAGLAPSMAGRRPGTLSGGERQRVAIARALATGPALLLLDEPVSALDPSIRGQILQLLDGLRRRLGLTLLIVSHDLATVRRLTGRVAVMHRGIFVETGPTEKVLSRPLHPYTALLLAAELRPEPNARLPELPVAAPSAGPWPAGSCPFAPRCPSAGEQCRTMPGRADAGPDRTVRCWHPIHPVS